MRYVIILLAVAFMGCRAGVNSHEGHDNHNHETHDHAAAHDHGDEGHDHSSEEAHGHEGHDHSDQGDEAHAGHNHDHIAFTREQAAAAGLETEIVELSEFRQIIETGGMILNAPGGEEVVAATSSGIISFAAGTATEGAAVRKGQTIATISARGLIDGDPATRARIELESAEREYRRVEELIADRIISQKDYDAAKQRYETARAAYPVAAGETGVGVISSMTGYVKNLLVTPGEYVTLGQPIATISANDRLQLRADVSERWFDRLPTIVGAKFKFPHDDRVYHANKLVSYGRSAENGYVPVFLEFANVGGAVPGAYVSVWLSGAPAGDAISVPVSALTEQQGLYFVYIQHGDEEFFKQEVTPGPGDGERVMIVRGLDAGDRVVTQGVTQVRLAANSAVIPEGHTH